MFSLPAISSQQLAVVTSTYKDVVLADNPIGYWRLGESTGTVAVDETGNNNGTYVGSPTLGQPGLVTGGNTSVNFNGISQYVNIGNPSAFQLTTGTSECWIKTANAGDSFRGIFVKQLAWGILTVDRILGTYDWTFDNIKTTGIYIEDNLAHHVVVTLQSGLTNGLKIYVDGVLRLTSQMTVKSQSQPLEIGRGDSANNGQFFTGLIDECAIYNYILTASQISAHYSAGI